MFHPRRVIVKLSGERLCGRSKEGFSPFDADALGLIVDELADLRGAGIETAVVCGAGNLLRGGRGCIFADRVLADSAGMLATVINALALCDALGAAGVPVQAYSAVPVTTLAPQYRAVEARRDLVEGRLVIVGGGTGAPFVTTDTASALRARELEADCILKATQVDGVYSADPRQDPAAERYERLSYDEVLNRRLGVMDLGAVELCRGGGVEIRVFDAGVTGGALRALTEPGFATVIGPQDAD